MTRTCGHSKSGPGLGRSSRPAAGLHHRDRGCRFPGCGVRFTQGHHLRHWRKGDRHAFEPRAALSPHHRAVHEEGYRVHRGLDGALRFRRRWPTLARGPTSGRGARRSVGALQRPSRRSGLRLNARTGAPAGSESAWMSAGRSTSSIRSRRLRDPSASRSDSRGKEPRLRFAQNLGRPAEAPKRSKAAGAHDFGRLNTSGLSSPSSPCGRTGR